MKDKNKIKSEARFKKARRVKAKISGTPTVPRLVVYRSHKHIYAQLVDDTTGSTLVASSTQKEEMKGEVSGRSKREASKMVGSQLADQAKKKNITKAVFDRNGYLYHGRVKAVAEGARENGLKI